MPTKGRKEAGSASSPPELHRPTVSRCRRFLQLQRKDSIPDKMTKMRADRIAAVRPKPGELVASKDKKRVIPENEVEISLADVIDQVISPTLDEIIDGPRMQEYADIMFLEPDLEMLEVDQFVEALDFFTEASKKLSKALSNVGGSFSSMLQI